MKPFNRSQPKLSMSISATFSVGEGSVAVGESIQSKSVISVDVNPSNFSVGEGSVAVSESIQSKSVRNVDVKC